MAPPRAAPAAAAVVFRPALMVNTWARAASGARSSRTANSAPVNGPRNSPDTANRAAVAGSDEVTAAANAKGVPIPSRANMTVRAARSVAAGRQVHHSDPNRPPTAMAASSQPVAPGRPCAVASTAATTARAPGPS
jgi:hypothetical protein